MLLLGLVPTRRNNRLTVLYNGLKGKAGVPTDVIIRKNLYMRYAPVICIPGSLGAGDSGDKAGPKCRDLTFDESRQCRRCAGVRISSLKNELFSLKISHRKT